MSAVHPQSVPLQTYFDAARLERVFNSIFSGRYNTQLAGGAKEPLYRPAANTGGHHILYYRLDYFASALHEVAHWCIAGPVRRQQPDFGYWYAPEGRSSEQQIAFEAVERKPQALEWLFSRACAWPFQVSVDNVDLAEEDLYDARAFKQAVLQQVILCRDAGLPGRAAEFYGALCREFGTAVPASQQQFTLAQLC